MGSNQRDRERIEAGCVARPREKIQDMANELL
jgi:hypothetical protein